MRCCCQSGRPCDPGKKGGEYIDSPAQFEAVNIYPVRFPIISGGFEGISLCCILFIVPRVTNVL